MDAIAEGSRAGVVLLTGVVATLIGFVALVALVALFDIILAAALTPFGLAADLATLAGWLFRPLAWAIGVPWAEAKAAGTLLDLKPVTNEFVAFLGLAVETGAPLGPRASLIMAYPLAGFANFGSVVILIGGLSAIMPNRRAEIVTLGMEALVAGTMATLMTGAVIGVLTPPG